VELAGEIHEIPESRGIPLVLLAGIGHQGDPADWIKAGIFGYLTKPVRLDELTEVMAAILNLAEAGDHELKPKKKELPSFTAADSTRRSGTILVVEDYPVNRQVAFMHLTKAGYRVEMAENGKQAVAAAESKTYDMILMDLQMPVMDGIEATRVIRRRESAEGKHTPIIALTAHAVKEFMEECSAAGMDGYITKPLKRKDLLAVIEHWIPAFDPAETPVLDVARAVEEFEGDREFLKRVAGTFIEKVRDQIPIMQRAVREHDTETVRREAHAIKGGAANLTADCVMDLASRLEAEGKAGRLTEAEEILERLEKALYNLKTCIEGIE